MLTWTQFLNPSSKSQSQANKCSKTFHYPRTLIIKPLWTSASRPRRIVSYTKLTNLNCICLQD